ncbi:hypothetical protein [Nocardioides sp.]|uniref:hypothetical protein n=1 Tax=Nocardioides sp. TaxID=35761 RepID=UPI003519CD35
MSTRVDDGIESLHQPNVVTRLRSRPQGWEPPYVVLLGLLVILLSALCLWLGVSREQPPGTLTVTSGDTAREAAVTLPGDSGEAVAAAAAVLPSVLAVDYRDLDGGVRRAQATMTPGYARTYATLVEQRIRPAALVRRQVTTASVRGAGLARVLTSERIEVLAFVDLTEVAPSADAGEVRPSRVLVTMARRNGVWKLDDLILL